MRLVSARPAWALALGLCVSSACGARSPLREFEAGPRPPECATDEDCDDGRFCTGGESCREGRCVPGAPVVCIDGDECTQDDCSESMRGACVHSPLSRDVDGDGFRGPRPGARPGAPGSCGNDCDDEDRAVFPGATEVCNSRDDDCNGVVDDNATFSPAGPDVRVSEPTTAPSGPGGVAWSGERYMASFWGYTDGTAHVYYSALDRDGARISSPPQIQITTTPSDAYGAGVAWTGTRAGAPGVLGIVWQDRRDGDYEIYFNRLSPDGERLGPDQRVSFTPGFSINPTIAWTGREFVLTWQDERDSVGTGEYEIYAQRIDGEGRQIEDNVRVTNAPGNSESPVVASSGVGLAIAWLDGRDGMLGAPTGSRAIWFTTLGPDLRRATPDRRVSEMGQNTVSPAIAWNRDRWVLAWHDAADDSPDHEIWGATRDQAGAPIAAPRRLTMDSGFSRYPSLVALGDRVLLVWADDRAGGGYDVYARMLDAALGPLTVETRVTMAARDSVYPLASLGPAGDVGILFRDQREGRWQVHFTRLSCAIAR